MAGATVGDPTRIKLEVAEFEAIGSEKLENFRRAFFFSSETKFSRKKTLKEQEL